MNSIEELPKKDQRNLHTTINSEHTSKFMRFGSTAAILDTQHHATSTSDKRLDETLSNSSPIYGSREAPTATNGYCSPAITNGYLKSFYRRPGIVT